MSFVFGRRPKPGGSPAVILRQGVQRVVDGGLAAVTHVVLAGLGFVEARAERDTIARLTADRRGEGRP